MEPLAMIMESDKYMMNGIRKENREYKTNYNEILSDFQYVPNTTEETAFRPA